jgi:Protein of unknown function (DUF2939).
MKRLFGWVIGLSLCALVAAYAVSPVLAARALTEAARNGDQQTLERLVDFPALRDSLKSEARDILAEEMRRRTGIGGDLVAGIGTTLAPQVVESTIDALITPEAVTALVADARTPGIPDPRPTGRFGRGKPERNADDIHQSWGYRNLDLFAVTLTRKDRPERNVVLLMSRRGLFEWKLSGVEINRAA